MQLDRRHSLVLRLILLNCTDCHQLRNKICTDIVFGGFLPMPTHVCPRNTESCLSDGALVWSVRPSRFFDPNPQNHPEVGNACRRSILSPDSCGVMVDRSSPATIPATSPVLLRSRVQGCVDLRPALDRCGACGSRNFVPLTFHNSVNNFSSLYCISASA